MSALGAKGFRPFFLLAGSFATVVVPLWVWSLGGGAQPAGMLRGMVWHAHEMIFGFTVAVIAGFLLTAVENWTKGETLRGTSLLAVAAVWLVARVALWFPGWLGPAVDLAFLPLVVVGIGRPLWAKRNLRNLPFVGLLSALWLCNVWVYAGASGAWPGADVTAHRVAVYVIAVIILVVAGRVVPMFTRNATGDATVGNVVWVDRVAVASAGALALLQVVSAPRLTAAVAVVAGVATLGRMIPWFTMGVLRTPMLWVLHLGHGAVGLGLGLSALPLLGVAVGSGPLHTVTVGGIGLLTLGMMARVSLGHTGRTIKAWPLLTAAFAALGASAVARVLGPWFDPARTLPWLWVAAALWAAGFAVFTAAYLPILTSARADGKPG